MVKKATNQAINSQLIENFINLQKVLTNLATKLDSLSSNISQLLRLFEMSAKSFAEKEGEGMDREFINKLNLLLEQNRVIARGITLIEERLRGEKPTSSWQPQPLPQAQIRRALPLQSEKPVEKSARTPVKKMTIEMGTEKEKRFKPLPKL